MDNEFLDDDGDVVDTATDQSGSALRKFGKEQKKRADELAKELAEIKAEFAKRKAGDIFAKLGISEKIRKFYSGDPDEDKIAEWWKENAELFGVDASAGDPTLTEEQQQNQDDLSQVQQLSNFGQERSAAMSRESMAQVRKDLLSSKSTGIADLDAALAKLGVPDIAMMAPQF